MTYSKQQISTNGLTLVNRLCIVDKTVLTVTAFGYKKYINGC